MADSKRANSIRKNSERCMEEIYFSSFSGENAAVVTQHNHQTLKATTEKALGWMDVPP